ncbi:MAG: single-stranded-DNA-specific exonuclease RecJ [bacterium]|nr:single-stranded-DNA-specific exonuclease RecJ [bacterium]
MPIITKHWIVPSSELVFDASNKEGLHPLIVEILAKRGISGADALDRFLNPDYARDVHDPFLFDDMTKAVRRIARALEQNELIVIHGDYDADGICGSTLLYEILILLGANVEVYIPHREKEGYGMSISTLNGLKTKGCSLVITVDCGIANTDEVAHANTLGIDVIITDHHTEPSDPQRMPHAHAIIHPRVHADKYPFDHLAGVGSAFKLSQALIHTDSEKIIVKRRVDAHDELGNPIHWDAFEKWQLDLVAIATITDYMPLVGENRALVHFGFIVLEKTVRMGLRALMTQSGSVGQKPTAKMVGFDIGPRINAAGRVDHARLAFELLTAKDPDGADDLSKKIEATNILRRKISTKLAEEAEEAVLSDLESDNSILCAYNPTWPMGVLGLVAGKLSSKYSKPVILCTKKGALIEGTSRSVPGLNIMEAFHRISDLLHHYGGHGAAAGMALHEAVEFEVFRETITPHITDLLSSTDTRPSIHADISIALSDVSWDLVKSIGRLEPFGQQNAKPIFHISQVVIELISPIGKTGQHVRATFSQGATKRRAIGFSLAKQVEALKSGDIVDVLCEIDINEWNGQQELQISILDMRLSQEI